MKSAIHVNLYSVTRFILVLLMLCLVACAEKHDPLNEFAEQQRQKVHSENAYNQADFNFWAALYQPTADDLARLREAWNEHGGAFPASPTFDDVQKAVQNGSEKTVLVSLFMTEYENADLNDKSLGWAVSPVPKAIKELSNTDVVLRTLMPVHNDWARYFLLTYDPATLDNAGAIKVSNRISTVELKL